MPLPWSSSSGHGEGETYDIAKVYTVIGQEKQNEFIEKSIDQLICDIQSVEQSFAVALRAMRHANEENVSKVDFVQELGGYIKRWEEHRLTFRKLLWKSRDIASEAMHIVQDVTSVFINGVLHDSGITGDVSGKTLKDAIAEYTGHITKKEPIQKCADLVDGFKALAEGVVMFKNDWIKLVDNNQIIFSTLKTDIAKKIDAAVAQLRDFQLQILRLTSQDNLLSIGLSALSIISTFCWQQFVEGDDEGVTIPLPFKQIYRLYHDKKGDLEKLRCERDEKTKDHQQFKALDDFLSDSSGTFDSMTRKIRSIGNVWGVIRRDLNQLELALQQILSAEFTSQALRTAAFKKRVERAHQIYAVLNKILSEYASAAYREPLFAKPMDGK
ncbi:hypothetical protein QCA50_020303 [Cerrena zonata]|uniref:Uncharacterized protein n=1 Tax=Cerrena zonata TaxID=2478898 RepID=A0AAW0FCH4_9APHY